MVKKQSYSDESIEVLEGLDPVRKRPGMYIGSTDGRGLHHLVWEIVDNAVDEALNGYGKEINITIFKDGSLEVIDHGRGVPCGKHPTGKNTMEVIYGILHAGGKFAEDGAYKTAGGLHGVGSSVVNALSEWMIVTSKRDGKITQIKFSEGGSKNTGARSLGKTDETGTTVRFKPDATIFSTVNFKFETICDRVRESSFLIDGLKFTVKDERNDKYEEFCYEDGMTSFIDYISDDTKFFKPVIIEGKTEQDIAVKCAFTITDNYSEKIYSFVNLVHTVDGGTHETGLRNALTKAFNEYGKNAGLLKGKDKLEGSDVREGVVCILNVSIPENYLQFEGQTKGKLGTPEAKPAVENIVYDFLKYYLQENPLIAKEAVNKMVKAALARESARKAREEARSGKNKTKTEKIISSKLAPARNKSGKNNELFLVEGDSAGGSAKQGRDSSFQAILPLRGKVLNTEKSSLSDVLKNEELNTIIHCLGAGFGPDFKVEDINYDKVVIMTDADTDGAHIQCLLLTFFYRYMRELIEEGHVFIALPPLYKLSKGSKVDYCYTDEELKKKMKRMGKCDLQRYKGLGEMNATQLWETTMNPNTRSIIRVKIEDAIMAEKQISTLMGDKSDIRKDWINNNVEFMPEEDIMSQYI